MTDCAWHKCGRAFTPSHRAERFCSPKCRNARAAWRAARGSALVDLLLAGDWDKLAEHRTKLQEEISNAT